MRSIIKCRLIVAIAGVLFVSVAGAADVTQEPLATVKEKVDEKKAVLVDVREQAEWDRGHVEGAIFLPLSSLQRGMDAKQLAERLPEGKILYLHCALGRRAVTAGGILEKFGYEVRCLKPGYKELVGAGFKDANDR